MSCITPLQIKATAHCFPDMDMYPPVLTEETPLSTVPFLPYELQQNIFELAAQAYPKCAPRLALVSSHVQTWIESIIYRTVILSSPSISIQSFVRTFRTRPRSFFAKYVRHLHIANTVGIDDAHEIVSACTGALTVECLVDPRPDTPGMHFILPTHNLRCLSIKIETLWGYHDNQEAYEFRPQDYPQLTHLEIVDPPRYNSCVDLDWEGICRLPSLAYLALGCLCGYGHCYLFNVMEEILRRCPKLRALIIVSRDYNFITALEFEPVLDNPRLVYFPSSDLYVGKRKRKNIRTERAHLWDRAERLHSEFGTNRRKIDHDVNACPVVYGFPH